MRRVPEVADRGQLRQHPLIKCAFFPPCLSESLLLHELDTFSMWDSIFRHLGEVLPLSKADLDCEERPFL